MTMRIKNSNIPFSYLFSDKKHMPLRYIEKILRASVYDIAIETPLDFVKTLSARTQNQIFLNTFLYIFFY